MHHLLLILFLFTAVFVKINAQSIELMVGDKRVFGDVQWLKPLDDSFKWSLFSRTRATVDYENNTNLFSGAYLNYTTRSGLGASIVGRISSTASGIDGGFHIFKSKENWMLFGLASIGLKSELNYSWFSIFRYTPSLNEKWRFYSSLELFSSFNRSGHVFSVQRIRIGLDRGGFQFGLANNLSHAGKGGIRDNNFGGFVRKVF